MFVVKIKKSNDAKTPSYAHMGDSGADLYSTEDVVIEVGKITIPMFVEILGIEKEILDKIQEFQQKQQQGESSRK